MAAPQCRGCHAAIRWITTPKGRAIPVDPELLTEWVTDEMRSGAGKVTLIAPTGETVTGWRASVITPGSRSIEGHVSHFATCPQAAQFKRGKESRDAR